MPHDWDNFYITTGTAAASLIGLLFVVISLGVHLSGTRAANGVHGFVTPTLVHFGGVLLQSLTLLAPLPSPLPVGLVLGACGLAGLVYVTIVVRLLRRLDFVSLCPSDWIAYAGAPALADATLITGAVGLIFNKPFAPFAIAAAVTLLLFVAIRDAWGLTLWIANSRNRTHGEKANGIRFSSGSSVPSVPDPKIRRQTYGASSQHDG